MDSIDTSRQQFETPDWVKDAIFYQVFPDRFARGRRLGNATNLQEWGSSPTFHGFQGGDLKGITQKIPYLNDLGINALYLNPIFASAANHRYHTYDYYRIDPLLGDELAFRQLIDQCHAAGIRVVLDGVFNHASRGFFPFNHLMENGRESPYADWFKVYSWPLNAYQEDQPANYACWWGMHALPKLNVTSPHVREFLLQVATYWLEQGADGWRLDVPSEIDDDEFWREFRRRCKAANPEAYLVGEFWHDAHRWLKGDIFDAQMNYQFARAAIGFFAGEDGDYSMTTRSGLGQIPVLDAAAFGAELERQVNQRYAQEVTLAQLNVLGTHDTPRIMTIANGDADVVRLMLLCQMTLPGPPNVYYGDEIGLRGGADPDNRRAFPWHDEEVWDLTLLAHLKGCIDLRKKLPALRRGTFRVLQAVDQVVTYERSLDSQKVIVALNRSRESHRLSASWLADAGASWHQVLPVSRRQLALTEEFELAARGGAVWVNESGHS